LGLQYPLLLLVFPVLAIDLTLPELGDLIRLVVFRRRRRRRSLLNLLLGASGKGRRILVLC
jgi:hypothetical protein